jgi:hypothetical protein
MLKVLVLNCIVSATATILGSDQLVIDYTVVNQGSQTVALFNRLHDDFDARGLPKVSIDLAGITPEIDRIVIGKKLFPVPPDTFVETRYLPYVTLVKPGATFMERITLPLPLVPWHPYLSASEMRVAEPGRQLPLYFELGMFPLPADGMKALRKVDTTAGPQYALDAFTESAQHVARIGPLPVTAAIRSPAGNTSRAVR